jgi:hypothetical protein
MSILRSTSLACIFLAISPCQQDPGNLEPINIIVHGEYLNNLSQTFLRRLARPCVMVCIVAHHETPEQAIGLREIRESRNNVRYELVCLQAKAKTSTERQQGPGPVTESVVAVDNEFAEKVRSIWSRCIRATAQPTRLGAYLDGSYYVHCVYNTDTYWASAEATSPSKGTVSDRLGSIADALIALALSYPKDDKRLAVVAIEQSLVELSDHMDRLDAAKESQTRQVPQPEKK